MNTHLVEILLSILLLADIALAAAGRLPIAIRLTAAQGWVIGLLPLAIANWSEPITGSLWMTCALNTAVKGIAMPMLLSYALHRTHAKRELEPFVSFRASLMIVFALAVTSFIFCSRLHIAEHVASELAIPVAFTTIGTGLFLVVSRRKAITQVLGFLVFENGIAAFGAGIMMEYGLIIELGILLDVFVLVFILGITMFQISRTFSSTDVDQLNHLGDAHHLHLRHGKHA